MEKPRIVLGCPTTKRLAVFEPAVFKKLAHNDTAGAAGHQGGILIPKSLGDYFPDIEGKISSTHPTVDVAVDATLMAGGVVVGHVTTRYQYQTWGATRSPERRLTSELGPLRKLASADDYVIFQRSSNDPRQMLISLVRRTDAGYTEVDRKAAGRRFGILDLSTNPLSNKSIREASTDIENTLSNPFSAFQTDRRNVEVLSKRKARDAAFRALLLQQYQYTCAITGLSTETPSGLYSVDAAHIVPVEFYGTDDMRNGILLSKELHWAFDKCLFWINDDYTVIVSKNSIELPNNTVINSIHGKKIRTPTNPSMSPHIDSLKWHRMRCASI